MNDNEERKNKIIPFPDDKKKKDGGSGRGVSAFLRSKAKIIIWITVAVLVIGAGAVLTVIIIKNNSTQTKSEPVVFNPEYEVSYSQTQLLILNDNIILCTDTAVTAIGTDGIRKWSKEASLTEPSLIHAGDYAVVMEKNKETMMIFGSNGFIKRETIPGNYLSASSDNNLLSVTFEGENDTYGVALYDLTKENALVFVRKYESSAVFASCISPDNDYLVSSGLDSHAMNTTGVISFIRTTDGEVYSTEQFDGEFFPVILPVGKKILAANTDMLVSLQKKPSVSSADDSVSVIWKREANDMYIVCGASSGSFAALVKTNTESEKKNSIITVYGSNAEEKGSCDIKAKIEKIKINGNILVYSEDYIGVFNSKGECIGEYTGLANIENAAISGKKVAVLADGMIYTVDF